MAVTGKDVNELSPFVTHLPIVKIRYGLCMEVILIDCNTTSRSNGDSNNVIGTLNMHLPLNALELILSEILMKVLRIM